MLTVRRWYATFPKISASHRRVLLTIQPVRVPSERHAAATRSWVVRAANSELVLCLPVPRHFLAVRASMGWCALPVRARSRHAVLTTPTAHAVRIYCVTGVFAFRRLAVARRLKGCAMGPSVASMVAVKITRVARAFRMARVRSEACVRMAPVSRRLVASFILGEPARSARSVWRANVS